MVIFPHEENGMSTSNHHSGGLSETEVELLRTAAREGYFKIPRETTLVELADRHDVSDREVSERLRSGLDTVVRDAVLDGEDEAD